jgi:membrane peptidoglycan carboxypeptidase
MSRNPYGPYVYVPLSHVSPYVVRGILTTEDHVFFKHDGFNRTALKASIERNIAAQEYVRGGSTISMQLVKNLYLSRRKVMSRKIQEAFLVFLIESVLHVPKARLLELYLNVIEFGPGVFGIHDASIHYFGKRPDQLTVPESMWIVTLVPSPKMWHQLREKREREDRLHDKGWSRVKRYMHTLVSRNKLSQEAYEEALTQRPTFFYPQLDEPALRPAPKTHVPLFDDLPTSPSDANQRFNDEMKELLNP